MDKKGLTKVIEECSELIVICAKKSAFMDKDFHPDGQNMRVEIEKEIADVLATVEYVTSTWNLDKEFINNRMSEKLKLYRKWENMKECDLTWSQMIWKWFQRKCYY